MAAMPRWRLSVLPQQPLVGPCGFVVRDTQQRAGVLTTLGLWQRKADGLRWQAFLCAAVGTSAL